MESGIRHEEEALHYFLKEYGDECMVIAGEEGRSKEENIGIRFDQTIAAMSEGKQIIYHGILALDDRLIKVSGSPETMTPRGETDFLFRIDKSGSARFGGYHYQPFQTVVLPHKRITENCGGHRVSEETSVMFLGKRV